MSDQSDFEVIKTIERSTIDRINTNKKIDNIAPVVVRNIFLLEIYRFSSKYISQKMLQLKSFFSAQI